MRSPTLEDEIEPDAYFLAFDGTPGDKAPWALWQRTDPETMTINWHGVLVNERQEPSASIRDRWCVAMPQALLFVVSEDEANTLIMLSVHGLCERFYATAAKMTGVTTDADQ